MRRIVIHFVLLLITLFYVVGCAPTVKSGEQVMFTTSISDDATPSVVSRIIEATNNPISEIKFEKGTYHFYPDKGLEQYCHISNHCDVMVSTAFPLQNFENLTIDGQGSTFIFHGIMIPFLLDESNNINIKNLSIDWETPFHSEGLIVANNAKDKTFDIQFSEAYPYEIRNGQLWFVKPYYEHSLGQTILYDPAREAITFDTESYTNLTVVKGIKTKRNIDKVKYKYEVDKRAVEYKNLGRENKLVCKEIKPGVVRVFNHTKKLPQVGMVLTAKGSQGLNRVAPAFRLTHVYGFKGTNVNIHHAGGMGIIAENSSDIILDNFNVTPSHGRMVSTTADATHFVGCRGKVVLKNCTFNNQLDDASNIHGTYQKIVDVLDDYRLGVRMGHDQQKGFTIGIANDTIGLVRLSDSFYPYDELTIKDIQYLNGRYQIITFNEKIPASVKAGDLVENLSAYPEAYISNCNISKNRARGLLLSTPKKTVVENCFFHTEMEAILVPVESGHWYESGNAANVFINNNTFQDCQHSGFDRGVIRFDTDDDNDNIAFRNVEITNNIFNQFDNLILQISNADGVKVSGNKITNSSTFPQLNPQNPVVIINHSENVIFNNNSYDGKASEMIVSDGVANEIQFK